MSALDDQYFDQLLRAHAKLHYSIEATEWLQSERIHYVPCSELDPDAPGLYVLTDLPLTHDLNTVRRVPFSGTHLTLWELIPRPGGQWAGWPSDEHPLFYRSEAGAMVPSWNVLALALHLLDLGEERHGPRDQMGRSVANHSPRLAAGLLDVPVVNEVFAAMTLALGSVLLQEEMRVLLARMGPRVSLCLSHDLDQLRGNDRWTQGVRAYRMIEALREGDLPDLRLLWWITRNTIRPRTFYAGNVQGMLELEAMLGFRSTLYFLNGTPGRLGARSGDDAIRSLMKHLALVGGEVVDYGVHYNFDTLDDAAALERQITALSDLIGERPRAGRAHYLRYSGASSMSVWGSAGLVVDESLGYPDGIGYRAGFGGAYRPRGPSGAPVEVPLVVMDGALLGEGPGDDPVERFRALVQHMSKIGGVVSLLFHPGVFDNPEIPAARHVYRRLLESASDVGARSRTALELAADSAAAVETGSW